VTARPNSYRLAELRDAIKPFRLHFFPRLRSTSDHAAVLRQRSALFAPALVLTSQQLAGRGRGSNTWFSAAGSITATFALRISETLAPHHLPLAAGLAVRDALAEMAHDDGIQLKWPNDLLYRGRKLAGLLCERINGIDLVGIGINVNAARIPKSLDGRVVFLSQIVAEPVDLTATLAAVARHIHRLLVRNTELPFPVLLREYDRHHALVGKTVTVSNANEPRVTGRCQGLDHTGRLLLRNKAKLHRIIAGHIEFE
jgi:BirA family biotin operon repressor/biotin-[acetyl-CoA-carboxylase] ligase